MFYGSDEPEGNFLYKETKKVCIETELQLGLKTIRKFKVKTNKKDWSLKRSTAENLLPLS